MQLSARTQRTDDEDDSSNTQQSNGGPKRHPSFHYAQVMDRPGNLVKPSQALYDFVLRAELWGILTGQHNLSYWPAFFVRDHELSIFLCFGHGDLQNPKSISEYLGHGDVHLICHGPDFFSHSRGDVEIQPLHFPLRRCAGIRTGDRKSTRLN